jgi:hypothetical protein
MNLTDKTCRPVYGDDTFATPCPSSLREQGLQQLIITLVARHGIDRQLGTSRHPQRAATSGTSRLAALGKAAWEAPA